VRIGLISDTHGLLRPEALSALAGSDLILHAGDVGDPGILDELEKVAPVRAVRGNVDVEAWARRLPMIRDVEAEGRVIHLLHNVGQLEPGRFDAVVFGHSHQPLVEMRDGVLFVNPGSAGPRRFRLPVTVAHLAMGEELRAEIVILLR
jgi:uncharacterized protein